MKKINIIAACLLLISLYSCNLDRYPFNAIEQSQAFGSVKDATALNNALYAQLRGRIYNIFSICPDIQTDLFHASIDYGNRRGTVYTWTFVDSDYDFSDTWSGYYGALSNVNNFLDNIDNITGKDDAEKATLANLKGEAHFFRAYYYSKLVTRFAKDYEPVTAATDLGVPLVSHFNVVEKPPRATVEQVYAQIVNDLKEAKSLITTAGKPGSERLTKDCVTALEARVYLEMHRYGDAVAAANALINGNTYPLANTLAKLQDVWHKDSSDESILMLYAALNELGNANSVYLGYVAASQKYTPDFIPEKWTVDLFDDADFRKQVYFKELPVSFTGMTGEGKLILFNKYPGNPALYSGSVSNYHHKPKVFCIAELHLIKAEALAWDNKDSEALNALNVLRLARGLNPVAVSGEALKSEIKKERIREMLGEGNRLNDLKRWKEGLKRGAPQNAGFAHANAVSLTKAATDDQFVWAIPSREITTNPNLQGYQNPGWGK